MVFLRKSDTLAERGKCCGSDPLTLGAGSGFQTSHTKGWGYQSVDSVTGPEELLKEEERASERQQVTLED